MRFGDTQRKSERVRVLSGGARLRPATTRACVDTPCHPQIIRGFALLCLVVVFVGGNSFAQNTDPEGMEKAKTLAEAVESAQEKNAALALEGDAPVEEPAVAQAAPVRGSDDEKVYLNVQDGDIRDIIKQISKATGRNFIIDDRLKGRKITILSERAMTKGEAYQTFLSALNVAGYTVVEGPGGIMKIVDLNEAKKYPIPTHVDTIPITDSFITRLVTLNNIGAAEMMGAIRDMLSRGGSVSVYPATNTLIITDAGSNVDRLMKIIKELDQEGPQQVMEIIPIVNASASDVSTMVNQLFEAQKQGKGKTKPGEPVDIEEVSKIIADERTNAIIVLASKRAMGQVREIIHRLDRKLKSGQEGRIHVYYLKHAKAKELSATLASLTADAGKAPQGKGAPMPGASLAEFEGGVKITADERLNALIITATFKDFTTLVDRVVSKLDVQRMQVYLESVIMELRIRKSRDVGVKSHGGFGGGVMGFGQSFGSILGLQGDFLNSGTGAAALLGGLISQQTVNVNVVGGDGSTSSVSIPAFSAFLSALASYGDVNVVSTPNILTLDNEEASISIEREEPIPGETTVSAAGLPTSAGVSYQKAGLNMKITPQVGLHSMVNLKIEQELSNFGERVAGLNAPPKISRKISTTVLARDGQTIVLGGLMEDQVSNSKQKIPILGDIPLLGFFFSQSQKSIQKSNLLIFITPHVIKDNTDFSAIVKRKIEQRNEFIEENYGKGQQEIIRSSIKSHREDLMQFSEELTMPPPGLSTALPNTHKAVTHPTYPSDMGPAFIAIPPDPAGPVITAPTYKIRTSTALPSTPPTTITSIPSVKSKIIIPPSGPVIDTRVNTPIITTPSTRVSVPGISVSTPSTSVTTKGVSIATPSTRITTKGVSVSTPSWKKTKLPERIRTKSKAAGKKVQEKADEVTGPIVEQSMDPEPDVGSTSESTASTQSGKAKKQKKTKPVGKIILTPDGPQIKTIAPDARTNGLETDY